MIHSITVRFDRISAETLENLSASSQALEPFFSSSASGTASGSFQW